MRIRGYAATAGTAIRDWHLTQNYLHFIILPNLFRNNISTHPQQLRQLVGHPCEQLLQRISAYPGFRTSIVLRVTMTHLHR